ncbi:hypothetical protein FHL15_000917 [Xylaria flabelliformis]|uniref:Rhodopsin domain-containing protein n=1 Tax=Xylaria flabelliformis TaxID=2512241 RepID=A0A553IDI8_9PEZI|nr:hypothetical protein FHL15_000917 [Xylaria flabelliformis]
MASYFGVVLNAVNWTLTALAAVFLSLRVYCKICRGRGLWWDDYILIMAFVCTLIAVAFISASIMLGFANPDAVISAAAARQLQIHGGIQNVFYSLATLGADIVNLQVAFSALVDFVFATVPWFLVKDLNMKRAEKLGVAIAMSFGTIAGITAVIRTVFLPSLASPDFSTKATTLVIWYTAEAATTIIAASIPVLRALIKEIKTSGARYFSGEKYASGRIDEPAVKGSGRGQSKGSKKGDSVFTSRVVTTITCPGNKYPSDGDTGSDKSILEASAEPGKIMQTQEVRLSYHDRSDNDSMGYEMDIMGQRSS